MADINIKTVTLSGGEVEVNLTRRNCHIRNLGNEMIYASLKPGIIPDADGVLGVPAGAVDVLHDTDGKIYVKGTGKVQLVGSDFADGILGVVVGAGIDAQVAAEVAKLIADAPEDFDTLKEISDWIYSHADSASEMNSEIQTLKTEKANKAEIPTTLPANGGNSDTVNGHTVESDVPVDAVFTDTTYNNATTIEAGLMSAEDKTNLDKHVVNANIHVTADDKTNWNRKTTLAEAAQVFSNPNLLINPDFRINQRGKTEYVQTVQYEQGIDRWNFHRDCGATFNVDTKTLTMASSGYDKYFGIIQQVESNLSGKTVTLSAKVKSDFDVFLRLLYGYGYDYTVPPIFDDVVISANTDIVTITKKLPSDITYSQIQFTNGGQPTTGGNLKMFWVKLELGSIATPFMPPDLTTELLKCQRYFQIRSSGDIKPEDLRPNMNSIIDVRQREDGNYEYITSPGTLWR